VPGQSADRLRNHEPGHALGLGDVDDPAAVTHAFADAQILDPLTPAPADLAALETLCGR
jgi:hypothetical protein